VAGVSAMCIDVSAGHTNCCCTSVVTTPHLCLPLMLCLQRDFHLYVVNMFDTGQAARLLGFPSAGDAAALVAAGRQALVHAINCGIWPVDSTDASIRVLPYSVFSQCLCVCAGLAYLLQSICDFTADKRYQLAGTGAAVPPGQRCIRPWVCVALHGASVLDMACCCHASCSDHPLLGAHPHMNPPMWLLTDERRWLLLCRLACQAAARPHAALCALRHPLPAVLL
jgi:hypothetical protein